MTKKIRTWHLIFAFSLTLIFLRINLILRSIELGEYFFELLFNDFYLAMNQLNAGLVDAFFSLTILIIPVFIMFLRNKINILRLNLDFPNAVIIILLFFFFYAPLVANFNPDFEKDISVTKLLPPFSTKKVLHLSTKNNDSSFYTKFIELKKNVVKEPFNENIIIVDSIHFNDKIKYYQANVVNDIPKIILKYNFSHPIITTNFYLLGTDELGRDIFSRIVFGTRVSLFVGLSAVIISFVLGLGFGFLAGYPGGFLDVIMNRITEMFLVFPVLFFIILILAFFGNSLFSVILVLGLSGWMSLFKIVRGEIISLKNKDYFITAKLLGLSKKSLLIKEILPVIFPSVMANLVFLYGSVILSEAALSYLGIGTGSSVPSWGSMIEAGQNYLSQAWWMILSPGLCLFVTLYVANKLGKKMQFYYNPRSK
jgi:peptide/nickel transport system permease protein